MLVGFKCQNHPQQETDPDIDDRALPPADFSRINRRFRFTVDVAASMHNAKLPRFWDAGDNGLSQPWVGERVYCNPPYSDIQPWVKKAWQEIACPLIVMLLPANRCEQGWWQQFVEPKRDRAGSPLRVEFLPGRLRFMRPDQTRTIGRPPFGCCLCIWDRSNPLAPAGIPGESSTVEH